MRIFRNAVLASLAVLLCVLVLTASIPNVPTGTWQTWNAMADARSGPSAALLQDGRVLIAGGSNANGPTASADFFGKDGIFSAAPAMNSPRSNYTATLLGDGRVLVTGGDTGSGITNSAEVYDPTAGSWTLLGSTMLDARAGHTASLLPDGRVLLAGGHNSGGALSSLEIFETLNDDFTSAGTLTAPRMNHAAAVLSDGRVLVIGGTADGTNPLATVDIYDPVTRTVGVGPNLSTPRMSATATTTLDGKVAVIGGSNGSQDLASAEVFDPATGQITLSASSLATPRSGHNAFLLPNNNAILIVGGTSVGADLNSAELYSPWTDSFQTTGAMSVARPGMTGSAVGLDGRFLAAGGTSLASTELYGFATVKTDAADYPPGSTVTITGSGWRPGETVTLTLVESPLIDVHGPYNVVADASGRISDSSFTTDAHDEDIRFYLTAMGSASQSQAQNTFTDATSIGNVTVLGAQMPSPVAPGGSASYGTTAATSVDVRFNGNTNTTACTATLGTTGLPSGASATFAPPTLSSTSGQDLFSLLTIGTSSGLAPGTYTFNVTAAGSGGCGGSSSSANQTLVVVEPTTTTLTSSVNPSVFGQSTALTATVAKAAGPTTPNAGTVTFKDGATTLGTGTLNTSGIATLSVSSLTAGSHSLTASYAGTTLFAASNSSTVSQTVNQASTTTTLALTTGTNSSVFGQSLTFTATVAAVASGAGTPTGTVTFKDGAATIGTGTLNGSSVATLTTTTLAVGSHSITAVYAGDTNFTTSTSSSLSQTVNQAGTTTTITSHTPSPSVVGQPVTINFTVAATAPGSGTPTGTVTVSDGTLNCSASVATGSCSITFTVAGTKSLTASYAGDTNFTSSTSTPTSHTVNAAATTITITAHTPNPSLVNQAITVNFTVTVNSPGTGTPTGNVTVSDGTNNCIGTVAASTCQLTPTTSGAKTLTASYASDGNFANSTSAGVPHAVNQAPTITSTSNTTFTVGTAGLFTVTATGFPASTFSETGALPSGVILSAAGVLSGTPSGNTGGTYPITITAANGVLPNATQSFTLTVNQAPAITSANSASFIVNQAGSFTVTATGFPAPTFSETGALPAGITLNPTTGVLSGTATATGNFPITLTASNGVLPNATQNFTLTIGQPPAIISANNTAFTVSTPSSFTVTATGFPAPTFTETGTLPSGVTLTSVGVLSGTPALGTVGTYPITITASNGVGTNATQNFTLTINKVTPTFAGLTASQSIAFGTPSISLSGRMNGFPMMQGTVTVTINSVPVSGIVLNGNPNNFGPVTFNTSTVPASTTPYTITYAYSGDANSNSASDTSTALTVNKATTTFSNLTSRTITFGTATVTLSGTIAAGSLFPPNGETVNITINSVTTPATIGTNGAFSAVVDTHAIPASITPYTVTYSYAGDSNFSSASNIGTTLTVNKAASTTTLVSSLNPSFSGQQVTFTATVTAASGVPTGSVQFQDGGVNLGSPMALINNGGMFTAQLQTSSLSVGTHNITAIYGGDGNVSGSTSNTVAQLVKSADTRTSISAPAITFGADGLVTVTIAAQDSSAGTPTGSVTLSVDDGPPSTQTLVNGSTAFTISHPSAGDHSLSASYATQNNFNASSATGTLHVDQAVALVLLSNLSQTYDGSAKTVTVSTTPMGLSVSVTYDGSPNAPINAGSYTVVVTVLDANYVGGATGTLVIGKATPTINWPNPADINYGTALSGTQLNATATFNANPVSGGFTYNPAAGTVLPAGDGQQLSTDFVPNDTANFNSVLGTIVLINVKTDPLYVISSDGVRAFGDPNPTFTAAFIGLVAGDSFTSTCSSAAGSTSAPGTYATICAPVNANNYSVHYISGTLTITNPLTAITAVTDSQHHTSETLEIGQTEQLTATGQFKDTSSRDLAASGGSAYAKADLSTAVSGAAVAEAGGVLYAIGGSDGTNVLATIQAYDPKINSWSASGATLTTARMNAAVASVAGKIYVVGGNDGSSQLNSIEVLDTISGTPVVSAFTGSLVTARSNAAAAVLNHKLYVVAGSNGSAQSSVEIFDLVTGTSTTGDVGTAFDQASASVVNNKLYVLGTTGASVKLINFDGTSWSSASSTSLDATKGVGAVAFKNVLYAINGDTVWAYNGSSFDQKNSLASSHKGSQPENVGSLIYVAATGSGSPSSTLDAFAPDEVTWSSTGPNAADASIDQAGHISALARTDASTPAWVMLTATSQADNTITGSFQLTVVRKNQTITFGTLTDKTYGDADFMVSATASSGLAVTFAATGDCSVLGSTVHIAGAGSCTVTAHQAGDDTSWTAAPEVPQSFSIAKATPTVAVSFAASQISYDGDPHAATATITGVNNTVLSGGDGTTTISYTKGGNPFNGTPTDADSYAASAHFSSSNGNYTDANSTVPALLTIKKADPTVTATGGTFTYDANSHAGSGTAVGVKGEPLTPVNVAYKDAANNPLTSAPVNAGTYQVAARYAGDSNYNPKQSAPVGLIINKADSTTTVTVAGGASFTYDGNSHPATVSVTGVGGLSLTPDPVYSCGHAPINVADSGCTASYTYAGDSNHNGSSDSETYSIAKADPVVTATGGTFKYDANPHAGSGTAVGVKGEPLAPVNVAYKDALNNLLTSAPVNAGTYQVAARYAGDSNYNPKQSAPASLVINKADSTTTVTVAGGESFTYDANAHPATVSVTGVGGLNLTPGPTYSCGHVPVDVADSGCIASYNYAGDPNHNPSLDSKTYTIAKATSTTGVTVTGGESFTYDGNAHPATVSVTGVGGLNLTPAPTYSCGHAPVDVADAGCIASYNYIGDANHNGSSDSKTYTIARATSTTVVTVTGGENFTYDGNTHPATVSVTGVGGLSLTPAPSYSCGHVPIDVTDSGCIASYNYAGDPNHNDSSESKTYTIIKATPAVTATATDATYNGSPYPGAGGSATGVKSENLTPAVTLRYAGTGSTTYGPSTTAPTDAGTYSVRVSFVGNGNYTAGGANAAFSINKADSTTTVTVGGGESFPYDGNAHAAAVSVTGAGGLNLTPAPVYSCGHAPINVADSGCTASFNYAGDANHNPSSDSETYAINPAASMTVVTVSGGESFIFDGNAHPATVSVTGVGGLNQTPVPTYGCGHSPVNVADSGCTASYTFSGDTNHTGSTDSKTYTISRASSTTTVTGGTFVFDGLSHAASVAVAGVGGLNQSGTPTYSGGCTAPPMFVADTQPAPCTASYTFAGDANHNGSNGSATIMINKAPSTTAIGAGYSVTYDGLPHGVTASVTGAGGINQSLPVSYNPGDATVPFNAGVYTASASFAGDANHLGSNAGPVMITINKASLTITAVNKTKLLNAVNPTLTSTYAGFVSGEGPANLTGTLTCTTTASTSSQVGSYPINCSGQTSNNYTITYLPGTLTITYATSGICAGDAGHQILQPINASGTMSVFKMGSTVPTKFRVCDANGVSVGTPGLVTGYGLVAAANSPSITVDEDVYSTTPDTAFRWDPSGQQWIFNQSTKNNGTLNKTGVTYFFTINLNDGSSIFFQYGLK
jgi:N-acetylneuraminic acid mutarotase